MAPDQGLETAFCGWAHTPNAAGDWHRLDDHLRSTAHAARDFAAPWGGANHAYRAGLWHDIGKVDPAFQTYLARCAAGGTARSVDHKTAGAVLAQRHSDPVSAFAIFGHHGGLPSRTDLRGKLAERADQAAELASVVKSAMPDLEDGPLVNLPDHAKDRLGLETFVRFVLSALVDADFLDTERHFDPERSGRREASWDWGDLADAYSERVVEELRARAPSPIDDLRDEVRDSCRRAATLAPGLYRLAAPTGTGKTIAAMEFAVHHVASHDLDRVIVAVPFTSITTQSAAEYRRLLGGDGVVLEHHSGVVDHDESGWRKLAAENWDAAVVVTTTVQLFESLFSRRPSAVRKLHRVAGSCIVLDEVQSLPLSLLDPILDVLSRLVTHYGCTVVLSTATQPRFSSFRQFEGLEAIDLVDDRFDRARRLRRVQFVFPEAPVSWPEVAMGMAATSAALAVVNTTKDAARLAACLDEAVDPDTVFHLSTRMCGRHRMAVIAEVRDRLARAAPCLLVSTQLIEAGVDVDFPAVWRAWAPADSLLQAAGRANREGKLSELGRVVIFEPVDGRLPSGAYAQATEVCRALFGPGRADPDDLAVLGRYYDDVYELVGARKDPRRVREARELLDYPETKDRFRMIPEDSVDVVVANPGPPRPAGWYAANDLGAVRAALDLLASSHPGGRRAAARDCRPFSASLPRGVYERACGRGLCTEESGGIAEWLAGYDPKLGVMMDWSPEEFIA